MTASDTDIALAQLAKHGKTFNWARRLLGREIGVAAAQLYAFCRYVDDIADGDRAGGTELLANISACLRDQAAPPDDETASFLALATKYDIDLKAADSLMRGLLSDQQTVAVQSQDALLVYAYRVAGTVGLMMAPILGCRSADARRNAVDLGIAMQLTNIARDVAEDAAMGRRYVPALWCNGADISDIKTALKDDTQHRAELQAAINRMLDLADIYYASGYRGLAALPLRAHLSIGVAGYCYQAIGHKLRKRHAAFWQGRVVIGIGGKLIASLRSLATLRGRLTKQPQHDAALHSALVEELLNVQAL